LHLLGYTLRVHRMPLARPDQRRCGLRPGEEVLRVEFSIGAHTFLLSPGLPLWPEVRIEHLLSRPRAGLGEGGEGEARLGAGILTGTTVAGVQTLGHGTLE